MSHLNKCSVIDNRSKRLNLPLPHPAHRQLVDVIRLREALNKIDEQVVLRDDNDVLRTPCEKGLIVYVRTDGSDANDGLSVATAKKTIMAARDVLLTVDGRGHHPIIDIGPGTFESGTINFYAWNDAVKQNIYLQGAGKDLTVLKNPNGIIISAYRLVLGVRNLTLQGTVFSTQCGLINLHEGIALGPVHNADKHLVASRNGIILVNASICDVRGNSNVFITAALGGIVEVTTACVNFVDSPAFSTAVCDSYSQGNILWNSSYKYTGTPIGKRYIVDTGGIINCVGSQPNSFLPGTIDGESRTNGVVGGRMAGVPITCKANFTLYVRTDGNDNNDGSADTSQKAFRTIQKALNYVSDNYSIGSYNATIKVGPGAFAGFTLPKYNASTGSVTISGSGKTSTTVESTNGNVIYSIVGAGNYKIDNLTVKLTSTRKASDPLAYFHGIIASQGVDITLSNVLGIVNEGAENAQANMYFLSMQSGGRIVIGIGNEFLMNGRASTSLLTVWNVVVGGVLRLHGSTSINGTARYTLRVYSSGYFDLAPDHPQVTGTVTGQRYLVGGGGCIATGGGGPNFFPGSIAGVCEAATYGIYL